MPEPSLYPRYAEARVIEAAAGKRFAAGVVLYDGETSASFGDGLYAVPLRMLWKMP